MSRPIKPYEQQVDEPYGDDPLDLNPRKYRNYSY